MILEKNENEPAILKKDCGIPGMDFRVPQGVAELWNR